MIQIYELDFFKRFCLANDYKCRPVLPFMFMSRCGCAGALGGRCSPHCSLTQSPARGCWLGFPFHKDPVETSGHGERFIVQEWLEADLGREHLNDFLAVERAMGKVACVMESAGLRFCEIVCGYCFLLLLSFFDL